MDSLYLKNSLDLKNSFLQDFPIKTFTKIYFECLFLIIFSNVLLYKKHSVINIFYLSLSLFLIYIVLDSVSPIFLEGMKWGYRTIFSVYILMYIIKLK